MLQKVREKGVSLDQVLREALDKIEEREMAIRYPTAEEHVEAFMEWANEPRNIPSLPNEALRRENIYEDRN